MIISLIAAIASNQVIGNKNRLPWHLPADLAYFKAITWDKPIVMGRKTYESIGKALPGRRNIVVSRNPLFRANDCEIAHSLDNVLELRDIDDAKEIMIIGGAELFREAFPQAERLYLTLVHHDFEGDSFFPHWDPKDWKELTRVERKPDEKNSYALSFVTLERI